MAEAGITINDLYALVVDQRSGQAAGDRFHWKSPAYEMMGKQIANIISRKLAVEP